MSKNNTESNALPNLIIIGAMKAGTSSLHAYLSIHPDIFMSQIKELNFFNTSLNWHKGIDWYKAQFKADCAWRGETSPNYSKWEGTAERMFSILPKVKLIYVLRDPVKRFVSQCNHSQIDPNSVVQNLKNGVVSELFTNGLYYKWYSEYATYYEKDDILLLKSEDLRYSKREILETIFSFLNLEKGTYNFDNEIFKDEKHKTAEKPIATQQINRLNKHNGYKLLKQVLHPLKPWLKPLQQTLFYKKRIIRDLTIENMQFLKELYSEDLKKLEEVTGIQFNYGY